VNVIETSELGKRYGKTWALRDCTLALPAGHLAALVGPNERCRPASWPRSSARTARASRR
jgi:ABC-type branched-subunit amino acid transport system ATPase component